MPFKSEKQRKWMHANEPDMAKKWEKKKVKKETKVAQLIRKMVREIMAEMDEGGKGSGNFTKRVPGKERDRPKGLKNSPDSKKKRALAKKLGLDKIEKLPKKVKEGDITDKEREKQRADKEKMRDRQYKDMERAREREKRLDKMKEGNLKEDFKNNKWEVYVADEKGREKIMKVAKSKRAGVILYNRLINTDKYHEVGMRVVKEGFAGGLAKEDQKEFEKNRKESAEVLGYTLTGKSDLKTEIDKLTEEIEEIKRLDERMDKRKAATILKQIGGNRFIAMTGAKGFTFSDKYMSFKIGRNSKGINFVRIGHNAKDLYDMEFGFVSVRGIKVKKKVKDVYADMLGQIFKKYTGMNVRL